MHFLRSLVPSLLLASAGIAQAASWGFDEAVLSVTAKGSGDGFKDKLSEHHPLSNNVDLGPSGTLKIILQATEGGKANRPHQAFLLLRDEVTGLETSFAFSIKETGKGKLSFNQKDLPIQHLTSGKPLRATLILASFGVTEGFSNHVFDLNVTHDPNVPLPTYEKPVRYGKKPTITHIFKEDAKSGPQIISIFFVFAVVATLPVLFGAWASLGANLNHLSKATSSAPIAYTLFFGSIVAMEGIFYMYYSSWKLYQALTAAAAVGLVGFLSGSKALSEVQSRRLAGER